MVRRFELPSTQLVVERLLHKVRAFLAIFFGPRDAVGESAIVAEGTEVTVLTQRGLMPRYWTALEMVADGSWMLWLEDRFVLTTLARTRVVALSVTSWAFLNLLT